MKRTAQNFFSGGFQEEMSDAEKMSEEMMNEKLTLKFDDVQDEVEKIRKKNRKQVFVCEYCDNPFATKTTLHNHMSRGICLGKGYMCLRCFKVWRTPSELQRHQMADKKCKISERATVRRDEENRVHVVIEQ